MHRAAAVVAAAATAAGHTMLVSPPSRNAADRHFPQFENGQSPDTPCTCSDGYGTAGAPGYTPGKKGCDMGLRENGGGQPCLWWVQGCSIGCDACATDAGGTVAVKGQAPHADKIGFRTRYCNSTLQSTLPREAWTMNVDAVEGSEEDSYRFNPWRAPGYAPVSDPCGQAGGKFKQTPIGGDSAYTKTSLAEMGDYGSNLPTAYSGVKWMAGEEVEVAWGIRYNHGGGYQYRLCPADEALTEECFRKMPLDFNRSAQELVWNNGTRLSIKGIFVDKGVRPEGSTWARNPIPRVNDDNRGLHDPDSCPGPNGKSGPGCVQFPPPCPTDLTPLSPGRMDWSTDGSGQGDCSGDWTAGLIVDRVVIPKDITPGNYVLSWRQDCEETAQVWLNCADVTVCKEGEPCDVPPPSPQPPTPPPPPTPPAPTPGVVVENTNFDGDDQGACSHGCKLNATATRADCEALCRATEGCTAITWAGPNCGKEGVTTCWTKHGVGSPKSGCYSSEVLA